MPGGDREGLTARQEEILRLIRSAHEVMGEAPSVLYIARRLALHHKTVQGHIEALHRKGRLLAPTPAGLP